MQKGQISANAAPPSMSVDISCLPVSTEGARNFLEQPLHLTDFWPTWEHHAFQNIAVDGIKGINRGQ